MLSRPVVPAAGGGGWGTVTQERRVTGDVMVLCGAGLYAVSNVVQVTRIREILGAARGCGAGIL